VSDPLTAFDIGPAATRALAIAQATWRIASGVAITFGAVALLGWVIDSATLKGAIGVPITMKANTALCLVLAGTALFLVGHPRERGRRAGHGLGLLVALIGAAILSQHVVGWDLGIDQLLFRESSGAAATASPGRMGPPASSSFLCLGLALGLLDRRTRSGRYPFRLLALVALFLSSISVVGYAYQSPLLYSEALTTGIAWPTALGLLALSLGVIAVRPDNAIVRVLGADNVGGLAARRLLAPSIAIPFLLLLVYGAVRDAGLIEASMGRGILAVVMMVGLSVVVLVTTRSLGVAVTEQTHIEDALRRTEGELSDFFESATIGLHWAGPDGRILRANKADMALLGYAPAEYLGRHIGEFHVDRADAEALLARHHAGENVSDHATRLRCKDGSIKEVLIDASVLRDHGRFVHTRAFTRDITEQRRADLLSRRLSAIVESSNDAIVGKDCNGIVTSWNRAAERMFGYTAGEMIGYSIAKLIPEDRVDEELDILRRIHAGQKIELFESIRRRKDGELIHVSLSISPILDREGRVVGASKIARDITDRKRVEAEREMLLESERAARSQAEQATRAKDEFLAVVSHELRTPLHGILGWSQYLKTARLDESGMRGIEAIERGARAQAQLIEDLLDMSRITSGRLALETCRVHLGTVIDTALVTVRPAIDAKKITLRTVFEPDAGTVVGDPARLQQIVWNLLSNAVKFTPAGGAIDVGLRATEEQFEVRVTDTGIGIEPAFLPHVFERFRQADSSTTRAHGGLGLGLSIARQLAELHGGTVVAESEGRGQGATFTLRLPFAPAPEVRHGPLVARPDTSTSVVDLSDVLVLVVEDDKESQELICRILVQCRADVLVASGGEEALELIPQRRVDVIVSDIGMPHMDGYQFMREVRGRLNLDATLLPAVALTAYARADDRARAMLAGYQTHIAKPVEPQELVATIASFVHRTAADPR
jgi:PAS domain S-box-containing protein